MHKIAASSIFLLVVLTFLGSCEKEGKESLLTKEELLTSYQWESEVFVFRGDEYQDFHWDCQFLEAHETLNYLAGDYERLEVQIELVFRKDSLYRRIQNLNWYSKCQSCKEFTLARSSSDTIRSRFLAVDNQIYFGTRNYPTQFSHYIDYLSSDKIKLHEFFSVFEVATNSDCYFNENKLLANRVYRLDVVFRPKGS